MLFIIFVVIIKLTCSSVPSLCFSCRGSKIFSTFIGFLKSKDPSDGTEQALLNELTSFDSYIKENVSLFGHQ